MTPVQPSVVVVQHRLMLLASPSSGWLSRRIRITGIGDHNQPEWLIRISGMRSVQTWVNSQWKNPASPGQVSTEINRRGVTSHRIRKLIKAGILPAEQVIRGAPFQIRAADLDTPSVVEAAGRKGRPCHIATANQLPMFPDT